MDELTEKLARLQISNQDTLWFKLPEEIRVLIAEYTFSDTTMHWSGTIAEYGSRDPISAMLVCKEFMPRADILRLCLAKRSHLLEFMPGHRWIGVTVPKTDQSGDMNLNQQVFDQTEMERYAAVKRGYQHVIVDVGQQGTAPETWDCPPDFNEIYRHFPALRKIDIMIQGVYGHTIAEPYDFCYLEFKLVDHQADTMRQTRNGSGADTVIAPACVRFRFAQYPYLQPTVKDEVEYFVAHYGNAKYITHVALGRNDSTEFCTRVHAFERAARGRRN